MSQKGIYEEDMYSDGYDSLCTDVHFSVQYADVEIKMEILNLLTKSGLKFNYFSYPAGYFDEEETE